MNMSASSKTPAADPETIRAFYDHFATERSQDYARRPNLRIEKAISRILPLVREESRVLDIGCGGGFVTERLANVVRRGSIWACDISETAITLARKRVESTNAQFRALDVIADFPKLREWMPSPVDLVVAVDVIEHLPLNTHHRFFENLAGVLDACGMIVLTFPSASYQRHLREHRPEELQVIDETIELPHLCGVTARSGFTIRHFSLEDVWLPQQYAHCVLTRSLKYSPADQLGSAMSAIASVIRCGEQFILLDQDEWRHGTPVGRHAIPFLERHGEYWGLPPDDATAISECERLRLTGARYLVVASPAFWWLEHYRTFAQHLSVSTRCVLRDENVLVLELGPTP
jgi:2-polyprenyl-3-methyl-5-hydroxy-6-metoxy-1,4-benzoquinol methylase